MSVDSFWSSLPRYLRSSWHGAGYAGTRPTNNRKVDEARRAGPKLRGHITSVKRQNNFAHEGGQMFIRVKLSVVDPESGRAEIHVHILDRKTPNLPLDSSGPGAGAMNVGAIRARHREMQTYRSHLESQGMSKGLINEAVMQRSLEPAAASPHEPDADGYLKVPNPIEVDVYAIPGPGANGLPFHVEFKTPARK